MSVAAAQAQVAAQLQQMKETAPPSKPKAGPRAITDGSVNALTTKLTDQSQDARTIVVYNISAKASEENLSAFFGYCGKIKDLRQQYDRSKDQFCWSVEFERAEMARTACMLHGTLLLGSEMVVTSKVHNVEALARLGKEEVPLAAAGKPGSGPLALPAPKEAPQVASSSVVPALPAPPRPATPALDIAALLADPAKNAHAAIAHLAQLSATGDATALQAAVNLRALLTLQLGYDPYAPPPFLHPVGQGDAVDLAKTIYVKDIPQAVSPELLKKHFSACGPVAFCHVGASPNAMTKVAFIEFLEFGGAVAALQMDGSHLGLAPIKVAKCNNAINKTFDLGTLVPPPPAPPKGRSPSRGSSSSSSSRSHSKRRSPKRRRRSQRRSHSHDRRKRKRSRSKSRKRKSGHKRTRSKEKRGKSRDRKRSKASRSKSKGRVEDAAKKATESAQTNKDRSKVAEEPKAEAVTCGTGDVGDVAPVLLPAGSPPSAPAEEHKQAATPSPDEQKASPKEAPKEKTPGPAAPKTSAAPGKRSASRERKRSRQSSKERDHTKDRSFKRPDHRDARDRARSRDRESGYKPRTAGRSREREATGNGRRERSPESWHHERHPSPGHDRRRDRERDQGRSERHQEREERGRRERPLSKDRQKRPSDSRSYGPDPPPRHSLSRDTHRDRRGREDDRDPIVID